MAATISVAACTAGPGWVNFPTEDGAPPRALDPAMVIEFTSLAHADLVKACQNDALRQGQVPAACARRVNDKLCVVTLPIAADVLPEDLAHMREHELRHCAGQQHVTTVGVDGQYRLRWLP